MSDIEIGLKIIPNIYLHSNGADELPSQFDASKIIRVGTDLGKEGGDTCKTIVYYLDTVGYSSQVIETDYEVSESKEDVEEAIKDVLKYKKECVDFINSLLEKEKPL